MDTASSFHFSSRRARPRIGQAGLSRVCSQRRVQRGVVKRLRRGSTLIGEGRVTNTTTSRWSRPVLRTEWSAYCLLCRFHRIGTRPVRSLDGIDLKARKPRPDVPPIKIVRFSGRCRSPPASSATSSEGGDRFQSLRQPGPLRLFSSYRKQDRSRLALEALREFDAVVAPWTSAPGSADVRVARCFDRIWRR